MSLPSPCQTRALDPLSWKTPVGPKPGVSDAKRILLCSLASFPQAPWLCFPLSLQPRRVELPYCLPLPGSLIQSGLWRVLSL